MENNDDTKKIVSLKKEITRYGSKTSYTAYILKGQKLKQLYLITKDSKYLDDAIEAFSYAIKVEKKSDAYCYRADLYSLKNNNESAVADLKRAFEIYEPSGSYIRDLASKILLQNISKLQGVKDTIIKYKEEGKIDQEFLKSYETITDIVMGVEYSIYSDALKN